MYNEYNLNLLGTASYCLWYKYYLPILPIIYECDYVQINVQNT